MITYGKPRRTLRRPNSADTLSAAATQGKLTRSNTDFRSSNQFAGYDRLLARTGAAAGIDDDTVSPRALRRARGK